MRMRPQLYSGLCQKQQSRVRLVMASVRYARLDVFLPLLALIEPNEQAHSAPPSGDPRWCEARSFIVNHERCPRMSKRPAGHTVSCLSGFRPGAVGQDQCC